MNFYWDLNVRKSKWPPFGEGLSFCCWEDQVNSIFPVPLTFACLPPHRRERQEVVVVIMPTGDGDPRVRLDVMMDGGQSSCSTVSLG